MNRRFLTLEQLKSVASALLAKINQKPDSSSLSDVSFTGDYNDLSNRPDLSNFVNQTTLQNSYTSAMQQVEANCMVIGRDYVTAGRASTATLGTKATAEGNNNTASGAYSHTEGQQNTASGNSAHAEGSTNTVSGDYSHAEGSTNTVNGYYSHAEGSTNTVSGDYSHAEGSDNVINGDYSHAEGRYNTVSGIQSHAEGRYNTASGAQSHAEGMHTTANHRAQHVFGEYNILDSSAAAATVRGTYVEIVGNGTTNNARSNARTLDWSGNETLAGTLTIGGANGWTLSVDSSGNLTMLPASNS